MGIKENKENADVNYAQNAMYGEESQQQSTKAKLEAQGGVKSAVATDVADASLKATKQQAAVGAEIEQLAKASGMSDADAKKLSDGILDGSLKGAEAFKQALEAGASVAAAMAGAKTASDVATIGEYSNNEEYVEAQKRDAIEKTTGSRVMSNFAKDEVAKNKVIDEEKRQIFATKGEEGLSNYIEQGKDMGFLGEDGKANSDADAFVRGRATFSASGMNKNEQGMIAGARVSTAFNALTGEALTNVDGSRKLEDGTVTKANFGDSGNMASQTTREFYEHLANPLQKGIPALISATQDEAQRILESKGFSEDEAFATAAILTMGTGAVTAAGVTNYAQKGYNAIKGNRIATETFTYDTGKLDKDNNPIMDTKEKGQKFSTENNPALREYVKNNNVSKIEGGTPGKVLSKVISSADKFKKKLVSPSARSNETVDESKDTQNSSTSNSSDNETNNKIKHNELLNSDNNIIQNKPQESKTAQALNERLDQQAIKNAESFKNGDISKDEFVKKQVAIGEVKQGVESGKVSLSSLKGVGVDTKDMHLDIGEKGKIDIEATDEKLKHNRYKLN